VPTYQARPRFLRDFKSLSREQEAAWDKALDLFIACLRRGRFEPGLRIKRVQGYPGVWEMTWAPDGRATFEYGDELQPGEPHIIWRRIGTHGVFRQP
jgi:mRNA-degrading endonuclease YafQ of YafQ-DinJ toxin-antitoxin module